MTMIQMASRPYRAAVNNTAAFTKERLQPFSWYNSTTKKYLYQLCFSTTREPPSSGQEDHTEKHREGQSCTNSSTTEISKSGLRDAHDSLRHYQKPIQRLKNLKRKEWKQTRQRKQQRQQRENNGFPPSLVQFSQYSYKVCSGRDIVSTSAGSSSSASPQKKNIMQSMNASALLDPLNYCKGSAKLSPHVSNGSRSISGTDAARRLLRGKKDFLLAARKLDNAPVLLDGHGVPSALFQHCVDMADALLRHYGPDVVECSFHNYYNDNKNNSSSSKVPLHVRVRRRDATNACLPPPSINDDSTINSENNNSDSNSDDTNGEIDWDHNLTLYLTVMERLAKSLGQVLELSSAKNDKGKKLVKNKKNPSSSSSSRGTPIVQYDEDYDEDDNFTSSPLLFPPPRPRWNVDILRGAYFDFEPIGSAASSKKLERAQQKKNDTERNGNEDHEDRLDAAATPRQKQAGEGKDDSDIRPFPIVEFVQHQSSRSSGHVLIRLQGCPVPNEEFSDAQRSQGDQYSRLPQRRQPVTLVFDACFQNSTPLKKQVTS